MNEGPFVTGEKIEQNLFVGRKTEGETPQCISGRAPRKQSSTGKILCEQAGGLKVRERDLPDAHQQTVIDSLVKAPLP